MRSVICIAAIVAMSFVPVARAQPVIESPVPGDRLGDPGDDRCPPRDQPCFLMEVTGRVSPGIHPFFAVQPLDDAGPRMWVQSRQEAASLDGSVTRMVQFGEAGEGAQLFFNIYLLACDDGELFRNRKMIIGTPKGCVRSEPVKIFRVR